MLFTYPLVAPAGLAAATAALVLSLLAGCARQPILESLDTPEPAPARTFAWECERNFAFSAREEGDAIWLFLPGHAVQLPRVEDGPGTNYRGPDIGFSHEHGQARLELPDRRYEHCKNNVQRAARERARLDNIDFRATGSAPDWALEIMLGGDMRLTTDPDNATYQFITPEPLVIESERKTLYSAQNKAHQIVIELIGTPCRDSSTGDTLEVTVSISIDDQRLKGCGGALH